MIHSPPLLVGASRMIPTSANSAHTRKMGRCLVIRAASSFSRCSGAIADNVARDGALSATDKVATSAGVKEVENRLCRADMICEAGSAYTREGRRAVIAHFYGTPYILLRFATPHAFHRCSSNLINVFFQGQSFDVFENMIPILSANRLAHSFDECSMTLQ
jgi:hypothetical protein